MIIALLSVAATLLPARVAHAADPSAEAQSQLRMGFDKCDAGNPAKYFFQRDFAFKVDPSIKTWNGKISKYDVPATLARCDVSMKKQEADDARNAEIGKAWYALNEACWRHDHAGYPAAKATFLAKNGNSLSYTLDDGRNTKDVITKCETELAADKSQRDKNEADQKAREAQYQADQKASEEKRVKEEAAEKAIFAKLKGDRLAIAREEGLPTSPAPAQVPKAASWTYSMYRGGQGEFQGYMCKTVITFKGNKKVAKRSTGRGCSL
jgi:hypothetical protein